jgi:Gas vesicle synthesis protein GvpL/GvpF
MLTDDPSMAARLARLPAGQGARYFAEKRLREEARVTARRTALAAARTARDRLQAVALIHDLPLRRPDGEGREMILNLACLLDHTQADALLESVRAAAIEEGPPGLALEALGPWPAFHFCPDLAPGAG